MQPLTIEIGEPFQTPFAGMAVRSMGSHGRGRLLYGQVRPREHPREGPGRRRRSARQRRFFALRPPGISVPALQCDPRGSPKERAALLRCARREDEAATRRDYGRFREVLRRKLLGVRQSGPGERDRPQRLASARRLRRGAQPLSHAPQLVRPSIAHPFG